MDKAASFGGVGGIRTLGRLLTVTRFPVVPVMTTSILLHLRGCRGHRDSNMYYTSFFPGVNPFHKSFDKKFCERGDRQDVGKRPGWESVRTAEHFGQLGDGNGVLDAAHGPLAVDLEAAVAGQTGALGL